MFPYDARSGLLSDLSIGLRAIVSQRLVRNREGELAARRGDPAQHRRSSPSSSRTARSRRSRKRWSRSLYPGSQTFEQALCRLYLDERSSLRRGDDRLRFADQPRLAHQPERPDLPRRRSRDPVWKMGRQSGRRAISRRSKSTPKCWIDPTENFSRKARCGGRCAAGAPRFC